MIVVKIELWPGGNEKRCREIGRMHVTNRGTSNTPTRGNYVIHLMRKGSKTFVQRIGDVQDYPRLAYPVWKLIRRALEALDV